MMSMFRFQVPRNPYLQFLFVVMLSLLVFYILLLLSIPVGYLLFGAAGTDPGKLDINNPINLPIFKYYQIVQSVGLFAFPPLIIAYLYSNSVTQYLFINKSLNAQQVILILPIVLSVFPLINLLAEYNRNIQLPEFMAEFEKKIQGLEKEAEKITMAFMDTKSIGVLLFNILMIAVIPAIGEELMFRGVMQRIFTNMTRNVHWGIILSSFLFSAIHLQFYGLIPRWILGMIFGYLLLWSGSMWAPIIAHFVNNAFNVIGFYLVSKGNMQKETLDTGASTDILPITLLSTGMFFLACYYFYKQSKFIESRT